MAAPLIAGNDLRSMSTSVKTVLTASEVIAVNQDPLGVQGTRVKGKGATHASFHTTISVLEGLTEAISSAPLA